jgi:hypothetical protein
LGTWELGNLGTWELGNLGTWELGNLGTWELGNDKDAFLDHFRKWVASDALGARLWVEAQGDSKLMDTWRNLQV